MQEALEYLSLAIEPTGKLSDYEDAFENLKEGKEDFHIFRYVLAMAVNIRDSGLDLDKETSFIGGFSLIPHLARQVHDADLNRWRGSHDVDIISLQEHHLESLVSSFDVLDSRPSLSFPFKKIAKVANDYDPSNPVSIDYFYKPHNPQKRFLVSGYEINDSFMQRCQTHEVFGIPVVVPSLDDFIDMKLRVKTKKTNLPRERDIQDILHAITMKEIEEGSVDQSFKSYSTNYLEILTKISSLYKDNSTSPFIRDLLVIPSKNFLNSLEEYYVERKRLDESGQEELQL